VDKPELKWFNPLKSNDWKFIDVFRWYLLGHDLSAYIRTGYFIGDEPILDKIEEFDRLVSPKKEYIINGIDQSELDYIVSSVLDASSLGQIVMSERTSRKQPPTDLTSLIHPWAVQLAEKTPQLNEIEYCGFMPKVVGILEDTAQLVRSATTPGSIVEGPLTWKSLHQKATKMYKIQKFDAEEDTLHNPEPIPNIVVGSEKDLILTSPTAIWAWDRYGLAPYSWPKNILYLAIIPDHSFATEKTKSFDSNSLITEKCKIFLEDLSSVYEKNRLGRHLPLPPPKNNKDSTLSNGIIKIPLQNLNNSNDQKSLTQKLEYFITQYLQLISQVFGTEITCFDKRTFLEAVYRDFYADHHSSAVPTDASTMPPPAAIPNNPPLPPPPNSTSSPMPPSDSTTSFDSSMFNHQQQSSLQNQQSQQNVNSPLPNMGLFDSGNPQTPDQSIPPINNNFGSTDDPLSSISISNGVDELMINDEENPALPHVLVIYIINPFFFGSANSQEYFSKLVTIKLLKSFNNILANLDHIKKPRVQIELIDIRTIFDYSAYSNDPLQEYFHPLNQSTVNDPMASINALRKLAFTVYSQPRQLHVEDIRPLLSKSMTRFGPFSQATDILDTLVNNPSSTYRIPTSPFILAPKSSNYEITQQQKLKIKNPDEKVLFVTYCLIKDDFLIVSVTDDRGELNDTEIISISRRTTPKKSQDQKMSSQVSLVVEAIQRLWAYIQGIMSMDTKNWRLVIGRFGKIGHGEFKAWTSILAKKNLQSYNSILKGKDKELQTPATDKPSILTASTSCKTCSLNPGFVETPALIAACLVSTEADAYFKIFPELLADPKQRGGKINPNDYSITHIMVFPTSPCISNEVDTGLVEDKEDDFFFNAAADDTGMEIDDIGIDINDLGEVSATTTSIANQPIAMGFLISTAPALNVPDWFWSQCPNAKNDTPVHLRSALHISVPHVQQNDDVMLAMTENHPLESNKTEEVLTYILQTYNELSWLNIDFISGQRKSCLPIHIQNLLKLYNGFDTTLY
jgi:mediator of RNA polymerase II transcription subunit 13